MIEIEKKEKNILPNNIWEMEEQKWTTNKEYKQKLQYTNTNNGKRKTTKRLQRKRN